MTPGYKEKDFFTACPPSYCRKGGPEIRYPFRLQSNPPYCGAPGLVLSCLGNDTLLSLPESGSYKVIAIKYRYSEITIKLGEPWSDCQVQNFSSTSLTTPVYTPPTASLVNCSKAWNDAREREEYGVTPISCLSSADHFVYLADASMVMSALPLDCVVVSTNLVLPEWGKGVPRAEVMLTWNSPVGYSCADCEWAGGRCIFDRTINQASCSFPGQPGCPSYSHQAITIHTQVALATGGEPFQLLVSLVSVYARWRAIFFPIASLFGLCLRSAIWMPV
ncbi:rust resistance kinase Lr10-like [Elaeis guineensis]|uniref:rust resistance kinase Lr10-like n=1 Tax=Elaeis guineensis var. tenera TaxID=51953 RepID=UPI003C6D015D